MLKRLKEKIACMHRHSIDEHPGCFAENRVNTLNPWWNEDGHTIGYIDIEADGLTADFATMLTWAIKAKDGETYTGIITKEELFTGVYDKRLISDLLEAMKKFKILVGYYSGDYHYDVPFIRTKAIHYGLEFPGYVLEPKKNGGTKLVAPVYYWDLYPVVKAKLSFSRRSLDNVTNYFDIPGKTPIDRNVWRAAKYGDPDAINEVLKHNIADVKITENLHNKLTPFYRWARSG